MGKSEGMVIVWPTGDHMMRDGQKEANSSASLKWRCQKVPARTHTAQAAVTHLEHCCMLQHPTISSHALVKPGLGCRTFFAGKSHTVLRHGCLPLQRLFSASFLSHFASCHQFAPDTCISHTWHLAPCFGSPGSSCCH